MRQLKRSNRVTESKRRNESSGIVLDNDLVSEAAVDSIYEFFGYSGQLYDTRVFDESDFQIAFEYANSGFDAPTDHLYYLLTFNWTFNQYEIRLTHSTYDTPFKGSPKLLYRGFIKDSSLSKSSNDTQLYNNLCTLILKAFNLVDEVVYQDELMRVRKSRM